MKQIYCFAALAAFLLCHVLSLPAQEFLNSITIPPKINSDKTDYHLNVIETEHNFNPMGTDSLNTMVKTFAFEDADNPGSTTILGPSIAWQFGEMLTPEVSNKLDERTTCHWHGAHVPQSADGGPHQIIMPGNDWNPVFEVKDKSATMWYHPHAMGLTYEHVQMGLSGMIYVEDPDGEDPTLNFIHSILPNEYGVDDIPLIFQTKKFMRDGNGDIAIQAVNGFKDDYYYMVNGTVDPVLEVPANMIRLRILNGDGKFSFDFNVHDGNGNTFPIELIATDAGYTDQSYEKNDILMAPGERTEWLLDFRGQNGSTYYINNKVSGIPAGIIGDSATTGGFAVDRDLLKIVVGPSTQPLSPIIAFPIPLHPSEIPPMSEVTNTRLKTFRQDSFFVNATQKKFLFNIDSTLMNMTVINDVVKLDSTEIWTIDNTTGIGHPWHIHDIHFWVTEIIENGVALDPNNYPELFKGPKDNVLVRPGWKLSYITTFSDFGTEIRFDSSYMYHCHILPHEDRGMMGQFVVWNGKGPLVGTEDPALSTRSMKLYPNPAQDFIYLEGASEGESIVRLLDLQGRLLRTIPIPRFDGVARLNVDGLPKGMLLVDWQTQEGKAISKVVLE